MRLRRLDLTRFGKFTGDRIDFGQADADTPDLHIVYGPNEAGKSTALAAYLDLLFGIGRKSPYDFLHPYDTMEIGGALEFGGEVHELIRVKRNQNDLLDGEGLPVGQPLLAGQLGGIDRDAYRAMFSLDDDTLEEGGENILASQGDLGQLLFAASAGIAGLSQSLAALRSEPDSFWRKGSRSGALLDLKKKLADLKQEREQIDTLASAYANLIDARERALSQYQEAAEIEKSIQVQLFDVQCRLVCLPRLAELRGARLELQPLACLPDVPAEWADRLPDMRDSETRVEAQLENVTQRIGELNRDIDAVVIDEPALKLAGRLKALATKRARYLSASDIIDREREVGAEELRIAGILARIGRPGDPEPGRFLLDTAAEGALRELERQWAGVEAASRAARQELAKARQDQQEVSARLREAGADPDSSPADEAGLRALADAIAIADSSDHAVRLRNAARDHDTETTTLARQMAALSPWRGDIDVLAQLDVPAAADLEQWRTDLANAQKAFDRAEEQAEQASDSVARLQDQRDAIRRVSGVVSDEEALSIRAARQNAWAEHRRLLNVASADRFEEAMRQDDRVMEARLRYQSDIAKLHQATLALTEAEGASDRADATLEKKAARLRQVEEKIASAIAPILPLGTTIPQFEAWLRKRADALVTRGKQLQAARDRSVAEADAEAAQSRLVQALEAAGETPDPRAGVETLLREAKARRDRATELKALWTALRQSQRATAVRQQDHDDAREAEREWQEAWAAACSSCWLREIASPPSLATVREILRDLPTLAQALQNRASLLERIEGMEKDKAAFAADVALAAQEIGVGGDDPIAMEAAIADRVKAAEDAVKLRAGKMRDLEQARQQLQRLQAERTALDAEKTRMTSHYGVASLAEVAVCLAGSGRKMQLRKQIGALEREIAETMNAASAEAAEQLLDQADRAALEAEQRTLQSRLENQSQRTRELFSAHTKAVDAVEAVGADEMVARIEEQRRTILLQIEEGARQHLRLRAGIVAAEHALRSYRQTHRSSMLARASEAFRMVSRGAYQGLASQPGRDRDDLIAVAANGATKKVTDLSKGTRFQLYLALRVAGYYEFARARSPVPFVADDIMETFDDFRAEETFRLLAEMAKVGQVIYLTHHAHLCDIARRVCVGVRVHELAAKAAA